jgi:GDPmannose 4,6-dehydratase
VFESAWKIVQLKKPDFFIIATGENNSVEYFVKNCFSYVNLDYKKYLKIDKKLLRPSKTVSLIGDTRKARKAFNFKIKTNLDKLISVMMNNDLKIELSNK